MYYNVTQSYVITSNTRQTFLEKVKQLAKKKLPQDKVYCCNSMK